MNAERRMTYKQIPQPDAHVETLLYFRPIIILRPLRTSPQGPRTYTPQNENCRSHMFSEFVIHH